MIRASETCVMLLRLFDEDRPNDLLVKQIHLAEAALSELVIAPVDQGQQDALVSWAMSVLSGCRGPESSLKDSTLIRKLNMRHYQIAAGEFSKWFMRNGGIDPQALKQRNVEQRLFLTGNLVIT